MTITDSCEHCGAKFQIDDAAISECKKKNKWECHCPGCNKYIDMKKYEFMFAYEFPGTENKNKNKNNIVNYAFDRNYPNVYKKAYLLFKKIGLFGLLIGIPAIFLALIMFIINCYAFSDILEILAIILAFIGMIGLVIALPCLFFAFVYYHKYWFMENFVRLVEKR